MVLSQDSQHAFRHSDYLNFQAMLDHFIERSQASWFPRSTTIIIYPDSVLEEHVPSLNPRTETRSDLSVEAELQNSYVELQQSHQSLIEFPPHGKDFWLGGIFPSDVMLFYNVYLHQ